MRSLDRVSQMTFEYWKDSALDEIKRRLPKYEELEGRALAEAVRMDVVSFLRNRIAEDSRAITSDYDEAFIRNMFIEASEQIDYDAVADRICFDYIPKELGIQIRRPVIKVNPHKLKVRFNDKA